MRTAESGNVLFYLLVAISLLAALTFAVAQGSGGSVTALTSDRQQLVATEIVSYADTVGKAATQLRLRGMRFEQLRFSHPSLNVAYGTYDTLPQQEIFNPRGGGINYQPPPAEAMTTPGPYIFSAANAVDGIGTTCTSSSCADLAMLAGPLKKEICVKINTLMGVTESTDDPPEENKMNLAVLFGGSASYQETIAEGSAASARQSACILDDNTSDYYFYRVLEPR